MKENLIHLQSMRNFIFTCMMAVAICANAQQIEQVDTVSCDTIDQRNPPIPQIPLSECDSIVMADLNTGRYAVVYKDGSCGIFDIMRSENVTRIEYPWLSAAFRKEFEGGYYSYFYTAYPDKYGVVGVSEQTNEYICILYPYKEEEEDE